MGKALSRPEWSPQSAALQSQCPGSLATAGKGGLEIELQYVVGTRNGNTPSTPPDTSRLVPLLFILAPGNTLIPGFYSGATEVVFLGRPFSKRSQLRRDIFYQKVSRVVSAEIKSHNLDALTPASVQGFDRAAVLQ